MSEGTQGSLFEASSGLAQAGYAPPHRDDGLLARARGCLLGQMVGDALGTTVEFSSAAAIRARYPQGLRSVVGGGPFQVRPGQVTDDTELALALARSLAAFGADRDEVARAYLRWYRGGPFDVGGTTARALGLEGRLRDLRAADLAAAASESSQANGSLMRCAPIALFAAEDPAWAAELARADSGLTHPHDACREACAAYVRGLAVLLAGGDSRAAHQAALDEASSAAGRGCGVYESLTLAAEEAPILDGADIGWVRLALQNAFYRLLHAGGFEEGLVATVMAGGDTDTNGCIAGALLGARFGEAGIPGPWVETVLSCVTDRGPVYQCRDARGLALSLVESGRRACEDRRVTGPYSDELAAVVAAAREAGALLLAEAARPDGPRGEGSHADVDIEMDRLIRERLRAAFPEDALLSEELGALDGVSGRCFVIDPHDGTADFLLGRRESSVSIALVVDGAAVLGVVYAPFATALTGPEGLLVSWAEGDRLRERGQPARGLQPSLELGAADRVLVSPRVKGALRIANRELVSPARLTPCASIATRLALAAVGEAAAALTLAPLRVWDFAAGLALLRGAGGALVDGSGAALRPIDEDPQAAPGYFGAASAGLASSLARVYAERFGLEESGEDD